MKIKIVLLIVTIFLINIATTCEKEVNPVYVSLIGIDVSNVNSRPLTMYNVDYMWFAKESNTAKILGILSFQLLSSYRISKLTSLIFGINYQYNLTRPDFTARTSDYYEKKIVNEISVKGNNVHSIGISIGVSYGS